MESLLDFIRSIPNSPSGVLSFVTSLLVAHGYLVIIFGAALDNFGLPASGDVVLLAGGLFANGGRLALPLVMLSGFAGAFISDNSVYWIGRIGGRPMIYRILKIRFLHFLVHEKSLDRAERYFDAHGGKTVFVGRFGPGLRSMTPLFAGGYQDEVLPVSPLQPGGRARVGRGLLVRRLRLRPVLGRAARHREIPRLRRHRIRGARAARL